MLNLPWQVFEEKIFTKIEAYAGMTEHLVRYLAIEEALRDEIEDALEHNIQSYVDWCDLSDKEKDKNKVKRTVTYDMGWQKRSSGKRYDSSSENTFIIGGRIKGIIGMVIYYKAYRKCDASKREDKNKKSMSAQKTLREAQKVWRIF